MADKRLCPYKIKTLTVTEINPQGQNVTNSIQSFSDCDREMCMAYNNKECTRDK